MKIKIIEKLKESFMIEHMHRKRKKLYSMYMISLFLLCIVGNGGCSRCANKKKTNLIAISPEELKDIFSKLNVIQKAVLQRQGGQDVQLKKIKKELQEKNITTALNQKIQDIEQQMEKMGYGVVAGILNVGNTCYMNSTLQVIAALYADKIQSISNRKSVYNELNQIIKTINKGHENVTGNTMNRFLMTLNDTYPSGIIKYSQKQQQDPYDFIRETEFLPSFKLAYTSFICINGIFKKKEGKNPDELAIRVHFNTSNLQELINNNFETLVKYNLLYYDKNEWQDVNQISDIPKLKNTIPKNNSTTMDVFKVDKLESKNIDILPIVLLRSLDNQSKKNDPIQEPSAFTLEKRYTKEDMSCRFTLSAFIVHIGDTLKGGHYISYLQKNGKWYEANDTRITLIDENYAQQKAQEAYIFFYKKQ